MNPVRPVVLVLAGWICIFSGLPVRAGPVQLDVSALEKWNTGKADGADLNVKAAVTPGGKGIALAFDLSKGDWVQVWQDVEMNLEGISGVRLHLRLTGKSNTLEVKLVDADGTNFGVRLSDLAFDGEWRETVIPYSQFAYFWGGDDQKLDLSKITSVWLAISKIAGGKGGVAVDRVELDIEKSKDSKIQSLIPVVGVALDDPSAWEISSEAGAEIRASRADNDEGLALEYKLDTGNWAQVHRSLTPDLRGLASIRMKVRQRGGHNRIEMKLVDEDGSNFGYNFEDIPRNDQWVVRQVAFKDFAYFWGGDAALDLAKMNSIWIAVSRLEGGAGRIVVGTLDIEREPPAGTAPVGAAAAKPDGGGGLRFDMEKAADWSAEHADGSDLKVNSIEGFKGRAVELEYELGAGGWVQVSNQKKMDLSAIQKVSFNVRMTGNHNALEIKLVDADGTNFGVRLDDIPLGEEWRRIEIPVRRFSYFWGGNEGMDWPNAASLWFAVSTIDGGSGKLALDDVELTVP